MANNHLLTRNIGNLRGFSTDSSFLRPSNVADIALNIQRGPDGTLQLRRGYQCQIGDIGGMGMGTFNDPTSETIKTVCIGTDGNLYQKEQKQIYLNYNGSVSGSISNITNPSANLVNIVSPAHGLITGAQVVFNGVGGATQLNTPGQSFGLSFFTITVVDANNFTLNGINYSSLTPYTSGGTWSIYFTSLRYLTLSIYVDPAFLYAPTNQSINCQIIANRSAQINGAQTNVNMITVQYGHDLIDSNVVSFYDINGVPIQRNVVAYTPTTITIDGVPVSVANNVYINQVLTFPFGKGFEVVAPITILDFINTIISPATGVFGLTVAVNGVTDLPAAFIQLLESVLIPNNSIYTLNYWYWTQVNSTISPPFPGSANTVFQNSDDFENASFAAYDDVVYIANGWDFPQKFDGQTVYRAGLPIGVRPSASDNTTFTSKPFVSGNAYQYATTYEQIDNRGHILEGEISDVWNYTVGAANAAANVTVTNLQTTVGNNWNTNCALATGGATTPSPSYGPDGNGFYYALAAVTTGYTLKIGDSAYYADLTAATISGTTTNSIVIPVNTGFGVYPGDTIYFIDSSNVEHQRTVVSTTSSSITIDGAPVSVSATNANILVFRVSIVFGDVAIVNGNQTNVNTITVLNGHTIQSSPADVVQFIDSQNNLQMRNITAITSTSITIDGIPVNVSNGIVIASTNQRTNAINLQRQNPNPATLSTGATGQITNAISNNLRINIYRTLQGQIFGTNGELFLVGSVPNNSFSGTQVFIDGLPDTELTIQFDDPELAPNPPPISKYLRAFGTQMFYAGGERGNPENSDRVFFSGVSGLVPNPEVVPLATNLFNVPNVDDDITGIGVSGSTLVTTKNHSLWAATGNFLSGQIDVVQIAPGTNIGCVSHASIASVGPLMYFAHTNGVYAITENQMYPTDSFGNPVPISLAIDQIFRVTNYLPWTRYVLKRSVAFNYTKDNQYLLFLPCEDTQTTFRAANTNSIILAYDYQEKNWFKWDNMNAAGGFVVIEDDLYFQERRYSGVDGNTANLYKQHRFYRLIDHADHAGPQRCEWRSSWEDLGQPEVRKKFSHCVLLMDRVSELLQVNNPQMVFSSYLNRISNLQDTIADITQVDNIRNAGWGITGWGWNYWAGYQDTFARVNLKQGTVAKSMQVGFTLTGINMDIRLAGFQLEVIPENRKTIAR